MPTVYCYIRESHRYSAETGISKDAQEGICQDYYKVRLQRQGVAWGGYYYDQATSGRHIPFLLREQGWELRKKLNPGDHLVVAYHDRSTRSVLDFHILLRELQRIGVTLHFANLLCDLSTPEGMLQANIMFSMAQAESDMRGRRIKECFRSLKEKDPGYRCCGRMGFVQVGKNKARYLDPWPEERSIMRFIWRFQEKGYSARQIAPIVEDYVAELRELRPDCLCFREGQWGKVNRVLQAGRAYRRILEEEGEDCTEGVDFTKDRKEDGGRIEYNRLNMKVPDQTRQNREENRRLRKEGKLPPDNFDRLMARVTGTEPQPCATG